MGIIGRIIYAIGGFIIVMLGLRLLFVLLGASPTSGLVSFVYNFTQPLVRPFFGIFNYDPVYGVHHFEFATVIAIIVYGAITTVLATLLGGYRRRTDLY